MTDIHEFEVFLDLAETMSFTKTADRQLTTQGSTSKQISSLETELDVKLFERAHREIELTEAGSLLFPYVKNVAEQYHAMQEVSGTYTKGNNLSLNISTVSTMINYKGFSKITDLLKCHPEFTVQLKEVESVELTYNNANGRSDTIHFARSFQAPPSSIEWLPTETDDFVAVLPKNRPLASKKKLDLSELKEENFLLPGLTTNLYQPVLDLCREAEFEPKISYKGVRIDSIINMIVNDMGIATVMEKTVKNLSKENTVILPISSATESYLAFTRKVDEHSLASDTFWEYLGQGEN